VDPRSQGLLLAAIITLSLAGDAALRGRRTRRQVWFMLFSANVGIWNLFSFLDHTLDDALWKRLSLVAAVLIPQGGLRFFEAFRGDELQRDSRLARLAAVLGGVSIVLALYWYHNLYVRSFALAQTAGLMYAATWQLQRHSRAVASRIEATRISYLVIGSVVTISFSVLDYLHALDLSFPPIGTYLTPIFMYVLSQSLHQRRVLDIYDLIGRIAVLLLMGVTLAGMFIVLIRWSELSGQFFLNAAVAALVILILFDPLRNKVEEKIRDFILRESWEMERQIARTRADLWHLFDIEQVGRVLMGGLEGTRRVTHAALYIIGSDGQHYSRINYLGAGPPARLEVASVRPLLALLERDGVVTVDALARETERRRRGDRDEAGDGERAVDAEVLSHALDELHADVILPISTEEVALGFLTLRDDRLTDEPYSVDDVQLLQTLATQVGVAVRNSQHYTRMKERDRLAMLGEMAAGLAHEIRNPLGSLKGAAQMLEEMAARKGSRGDEDGEEPEGAGGDDSGMFLNVIIEETNRLNRVVSNFLDYSRPYQGNPEPLDVNEVIRRTVQIEEAARDHEVAVALDLSEDLPPVKADPERLHQVFINLVRNAVQAMGRAGDLSISSRLHRGRRTRRERDRVEIRFSDRGPGIDAEVRKKLFVPFSTTKTDGTGLGLAICQRIVQDMGGSIELESTSERGTTFVISLPACEDTEIESIVTSTGPISARI
jgi:signal transduction histidine kinase